MRRSKEIGMSHAGAHTWGAYVGRIRGARAIRFYLPLNVQLPNDFFAQAVIVAKDVAARERARHFAEPIFHQAP
jgi:hypothetical protein